jgi:hypothetical protein
VFRIEARSFYFDGVAWRSMLRDGTDGRASRRAWAIAAGLVAAAHFASFDIVERAIFTDARYFLYFAQQTAHGAVPHLDFFDNKTQLATLVAAAFYRIGELTGVEPLLVIRAGNLALAAVAATLLFEVHRRLAGGLGIAGMLPLLGSTGFALLGVLPAIGPIPKLLMALCASVAALAAGNGRWIVAGAASTLAFLDWQVGGLAFVAVVAAAACGRGARRRSVTRALLGAGLGALPFALYFAATGAVGAAIRQILSASIERGAAYGAQRTAAERLDHLWDIVRQGCDGHVWMVFPAAAGTVVFFWWIRRHAGRPTLPLAVALAVYHYGLIAFSLIDFQHYGDLFALLHTASFFLGVTLVEVFSRISNRAPSRAAAWLGIAALAVAVAAFRPSLLRPAFDLQARDHVQSATLADQREVARSLAPLVQGKRVAFVEHTEQLFLLGLTNALPIVYWNPAACTYFRAPGEAPVETWHRMLRGSLPDVVATRDRATQLNRAPMDPSMAGAYRTVALESAGGRYRIEVHVRK